MKQSLFSLSWKELKRSASFTRSVATTIMLGFLALYFTSVFLVLGFVVIPKGLADNFPNQELTSKLNSFLLIYFMVDLMIRQFVQNLPTINFKPFSILNVKRKKIVRYLLNRSLLHFFNLLPYFLILPLFFRIVAADHPGSGAGAWLFSITMLILTNHFLNTYLKWWINESTWGIYLFMGVFALLFGLNFWGLVDFTGLFGSMLDYIILNPVWCLALCVLPILLYVLNFRYLKSNLYLNLVEKKSTDTKVRDFSWINQLGEFGKFITLHVHMIWRNKRPRSQFVMTVIFLLYGFLIYKDNGHGIPEGILILGGLLMTGMFTISMGQFFPAWHSRYYAMLMTQNFRMKQFLQAFYYMNVIISFIYFVVTLLYAFIDIRVLYFNTALFFYHLGVNMNLIFFFGTKSKKAVDLGGSAMFNYQGMGAAQWLIAFPLIVGPIVVFYLFKWGLGSVPALTVMGAIGVLGIVMQARLFDYFEKAYQKQKHRMIRDYKNS